MALNPRGNLPPNFPTKPTPALPQILSYPRDLIADDRNFYMQTQFVEYNTLARNYLTGGTTPFPTPTGGVILPLPKRINDRQTVVWQEESLTSTAASMSGQAGRALAAAGPLGGGLGLAINPFLWMLFKSPQFKTFTFSWTLVPNNEQESLDIVKIIDNFKYNQLPLALAGGFVYQYPSIALIKLYPNNQFTTRIRPCAIIDVDTDYTPAGYPSFFKNGAPTVINFTVYFKEIELWTKNNYYG